eukprot:1159749-Pelagomonas_calceolata.AAC.5
MCASQPAWLVVKGTHAHKVPGSQKQHLDCTAGFIQVSGFKLPQRLPISLAHLYCVVSTILPCKALKAPPNIHDFQGHKALPKFMEVEGPLGCAYKITVVSECMLRMSQGVAKKLGTAAHTEKCHSASK